MAPVADVMGVEPLAEKYGGFGWHVLRMNGHDMEEVWIRWTAKERLEVRPTLLICYTIKGKGVSFMENVGVGMAGFPI